jgi:hypothetical protein
VASSVITEPPAAHRPLGEGGYGHIVSVIGASGFHVSLLCLVVRGSIAARAVGRLFGRAVG